VPPSTDYKRCKDDIRRDAWKAEESPAAEWPRVVRLQMDFLSASSVLTWQQGAGPRGLAAGTKWEEILVITENDAWWLDDDVPHVRKAVRKGWMQRVGAPLRPVREREPVAALVC
jgi:hypothetical protein